MPCKPRSVSSRRITGGDNSKGKRTGGKSEDSVALLAEKSRALKRAENQGRRGQSGRRTARGERGLGAGERGGKGGVPVGSRSKALLALWVSRSSASASLEKGTGGFLTFVIRSLVWCGKQTKCAGRKRRVR